MVNCSIVIPVFNQLDYTRSCIENIFKNSDAGISYEVIVVNNGSTDGTAEYLAQTARSDSRVRVVTFDSNRGFSPASNAGADAAGGDVLIFLNNDCEPQKNWITPLLEEINEPDIGLAGPLLLFPGGDKVNHAGYVYIGETNAFYPIYFGSSSTFYGVRKRREHQALLGACVAIKKSLFQSLGQFATYGLEDIDLCLKVRERGAKVFLTPLSEVYHHGSVTLANSAPGTIPCADVTAFNARWPAQAFVSDYKRFYLEDGFEARLDGEKKLQFDARQGDAYHVYFAGEKQLQNGEAALAEQSFRHALTLYAQLPEALAALVALLIDQKCFEEAIHFQEVRAQVSARNGGALVELAQICLTAGARARTEELCKFVLRRSYPTQEEKARALDLLKSLERRA